MSEDRIIEKWCCVGHRAGSRKSPTAEVALFRPIAEDGTLGDDLLPFGFKQIVPGAIYNIETNAERDHAIKINFVEMWSDAEDLAEWRAVSKTASVARAAARAEARGRRADPILACLKPLRRAYQRTHWANRMALKLIVLAALEKPVAEDDDD